MSHLRRFKANFPLNNSQGTYLIISAIVLTVLFGFAAMGVEIGRWYAIQGELSKSVDGAAFAGAQNVNNDNIDLQTFVKDVAEANFPKGLLGTDFPTFNVATDKNGKVTVDGSTHSLNTLAKAVHPSFSKTRVVANGAAKLRKAEIALVLDVSGSMNTGGAIRHLRDGATLFVENFKDQEDKSRFALITFASGVQNLYDLDHGYVSPLTTKIKLLQATGGTNAEDALAQAAALPWEDQSGLSANEKKKQVVIFFSDGNPSFFRADFKSNGVTYDATTGLNYYQSDIITHMYSPDKQSAIIRVRVKETGDGLPLAETKCLDTYNKPRLNAKWFIFEDPTYGLDSFPDTAGYDPEDCLIPHPSPLKDYVRFLVRQMALDHAAGLKAQGIEIYTIGLGNVDQDYLAELSSGPEFQFYTADSTELEGIFQRIANVLKLVLVK